MRPLTRKMALLALPLFAAQFSTGAFADVVISIAPTKNMSCVSGVCTPTAKNAVLNVTDLTNALNARNLEVTTGTQRGNIDIEAAFHWVSGYALTLDAFHSIRVDQPVTDAGTGALTLTTNDGGANGHLEFGASGNITFWSLANALTVNGKPYTLVNSVASLAAAVASNASGDYALAASYDASVDHTYKQDPITPVFSGDFEGLGNAISNISIRVDSASEGFFNEIEAGASVSSFRLLNATVIQPASSGYIGSLGVLAGGSYGTLYDDAVSGTTTSVLEVSSGGLVGIADGTITRCSASVAMKSPDHEQEGIAFVGGLVGESGAAITDSVSSGIVTASYLTKAAGGLVGWSVGPIRHSRAAGNVYALFASFDADLGGLVGRGQSIVFDSYATGDVDGGQMAGGLVGLEAGEISTSFATGKVLSGKYSQPTLSAGGLVGLLTDGPPGPDTTTVTNSYAIGAVTAGGYTGGLIGGGSNRDGTITTSYAAGDVAGQSSFVGGFAGLGCACFSKDYWDITTSTQTDGVGDGGNSTGITGLTTTQLQSGLPAGFDPKIWAQDRKINRGFPYLIANPPPQ